VRARKTGSPDRIAGSDPAIRSYVRARRREAFSIFSEKFFFAVIYGVLSHF